MHCWSTEWSTKAVWNMVDLVLLQAIVYVNDARWYMQRRRRMNYYFCFKIKIFYNFCFIYFFENIQFRLNGIKLSVFISNMKKKQKICLGLTSELVSVSSLHVSLSMLSWPVCSLRRGVILISCDGGDGCYGLRILFSTLIIHGLHSAFSQSGLLGHQPLIRQKYLLWHYRTILARAGRIL